MNHTEKKCDIGLVGLAVMGENLVLNMANHDFKVAVFNRTTSKVDAIIESIIPHLEPGDIIFASKICSYAQGYQLMRSAAEEYQWNLNYGEVALMWRGGCIIRAQFPGDIKETYDNNPGLQNLLLDGYFKNAIETSQSAWRKVVATTVIHGVLDRHGR